MPEQNEVAASTTKKRGRSSAPKRKANTNNRANHNVETNAYAYNTTLPYIYSVLGDFLDASPYTIKDIRTFSKNPQYYNKQLRDLAWWAYNTNGSVRSAVNYIGSMHTLDKVIVCKNRKKRPKNFERNRLKMLSVLDKINYKQQIRDNLMKNANDGTAFYYFETANRPISNEKFISDYQMANIVEINEIGMDVSIIPLPVDWCRICGRVGNHYRMAFNLRYFDQFNDRELKARLQAMPKEIRDGYNQNKGTSSLTKDQQREQHEKVKEAVITRRSQSGISFFSLASGTKIDKMDVDIDIFDEKNEASIKDAVPGALGISSASLDGNTKGNYATASLNLELVASNTYTWVENFMFELNKCINANIIMDSSCVVDCYILPTTFANRDKQVKYMQDLYSHGKGSLTAWVSATGFDPDAYISLLDYELESDFENKYPVHATSFTMSGRDEADSKESGRETVDFATNENTIQSQSSGSNTNPKPSTD